MTDEAADRDAAPDPPAPSLRAKPLPRRLPLATDAPDLVPARMINEALYCERLMYLEWAQGEFTDNVFTVDGRSVHTRADVPGGALPPTDPDERAETTAAKRKSKKAKTDDPVAGADPPSEDEREPPGDAEDDGPPPYEARSLWLSSEPLGMTAKIDVVEGSASGVVVPIEYKRGAAPEIAEGAYLPERAQLCAQVLILRDNGYRCDHGEIYFARSRRRVVITMDETLIETTKEAARRAKELTAAGVMPPPLVDSPKCDGCSLVGICLPDETNLLRGASPANLADASVGEPSNAMDAFWPIPPGDEDAKAEPENVLRRLQPARDDELPLYVQDQGAKVSLSGEELIVPHPRRSHDGARAAPQRFSADQPLRKRADLDAGHSGGDGAGNLALVPHERRLVLRTRHRRRVEEHRAARGPAPDARRHRDVPLARAWAWWRRRSGTAERYFAAITRMRRR